MKMRRRFIAVFDRTIDSLAYLADVIIICLMLAVVVGVVMRLIGIPVLGLFEITEYSLLFITFLGAAWLLKKEGHVKMDILLSRLSARDQTLVNIITSIIGVIICLAVTWYGVRVTLESFQTGYFTQSYLKLPRAPLLAVIPVGGFLLFVQFLRRTYGFLESWRLSRDQA